MDTWTPDKRVTKVETAEFKGTQELYINTHDGWAYVFDRLGDDEPYSFKHKRAPDGSKSDMRSRTPERVVEFMEENYDCANLHPDFEKGEGGWDDV